MIFLLLFLLNSTLVIAEKRMIFEATEDSMSGWVTYSSIYGNEPSFATTGWKEKNDAGHWSAYGVCDIGDSSNINITNWLWVPFIENKYYNSSLIHIDISFGLKICDENLKNQSKCWESLMLAHYLSDEPTITNVSETWIFEDSYDLRWDDNTALSIPMNTSVDELEEYSKTGKPIVLLASTSRILGGYDGLNLAIVDAYRACGEIYSVSMYYKVCPETKMRFAKAPEMPTGEDFEGMREAKGECVANAATSQGNSQPTFVCDDQLEQWFEVSNYCECIAGYQPEEHGWFSTCTACPPGTFKPELGNHPCTPCSPCSPTNLTLVSANKTSAKLSWNPPHDDGGRTDTVYRVSCDICGSQVKFYPDTETFKETYLWIDNLIPGTSYRIEVASESEVSSAHKQDPPQSTSITVFTEPADPALFKKVEDILSAVERMEKDINKIKKEINMLKT